MNSFKRGACPQKNWRLLGKTCPKASELFLMLSSWRLRHNLNDRSCSYSPKSPFAIWTTTAPFASKHTTEMLLALDLKHSWIVGIQNLSPGQDLPNLPALRQRVQELEREASEAAAALLQAQRQQQLIVENQDRIRLGLAELDVAVPLEIDLHHVIDEAIQETDRTLDHLSTARARGETLALSLARAGQLARKTEIEQQVQQINNELRPTRIEIDARRNTGELISKMIDGIRRASSDLVENELRRTEPLLERIYATVDPHPEFRVARLISRMRQGHGQYSR